MIGTFAFMLGTVFRSSSLAIGVSIFLMFVGVQLVFLLQRFEIVKYYLFTHTDLTISKRCNTKTRCTPTNIKKIDTPIASELERKTVPSMNANVPIIHVLAKLSTDSFNASAQ